jgi:hypothetical protein
MSRYPEVKQSGLNPLVHYVLYGGAKGMDPNRHFNSRGYVEHYPGACQDGMTPLGHFITAYDNIGYNPHPGYPRIVRARSIGSVPAQLSLASARSHLRRAAEWRNSVTEDEVPVFVVYGAGNVRSIESRLIPALAAQRASVRFRLHLLHYRNSQCLFSPSALQAKGGNLSGVTDWSASRSGPHLGFGEAVNWLFERVAPKQCFYLVNPDSAPMDGCMEKLLMTLCTRSAAIVEARQWPSEHPKEFDTASGATPWASGAFVLIAAHAFRVLNGFDPIYFLYNEDVDLSWRAWLAEMPVIYEPAAVCAHFTGAFSYQRTRFYYENFFSMRNFLLVAYKFFGEEGEAAAWRWIQNAPVPGAFVQEIESSYRKLRGRVERVQAANPYYGDKVKILGLNLYHTVRRV